MVTQNFRSGFHLYIGVDSLSEVTVSREGTLEFEEFFSQEYARLGKAVYLLTGNASEAEEIVQETMARVYERWDRVRTARSPQAYAVRVAYNLYRRRFRYRWAPLQDAPASGPEAEVGTRDAVLRALAVLTPGQRAAMVLVEWLGYTDVEAGEVLGIAPASVRGRLHRARETVRARLGGPDG